MAVGYKPALRRGSRPPGGPRRRRFAGGTGSGRGARPASGRERVRKAGSRVDLHDRRHAAGAQRTQQVLTPRGARRVEVVEERPRGVAQTRERVDLGGVWAGINVGTTGVGAKQRHRPEVDGSVPRADADPRSIPIQDHVLRVAVRAGPVPVEDAVIDDEPEADNRCEQQRWEDAVHRRVQAGISEHGEPGERGERRDEAEVDGVRQTETGRARQTQSRRVGGRAVPAGLGRRHRPLAATPRRRRAPGPAAARSSRTTSSGSRRASQSRATVPPPQPTPRGPWCGRLGRSVRARAGPRARPRRRRARWARRFRSTPTRSAHAA